MTGQRRLDFANQLLYETPGGKRFTQDSPILTNVWLQYARKPRCQQKLILTVSRDRSAGKAASELREMLAHMRRREQDGAYALAAPLDRKRVRVSYIPGQISAELYFDEMMRLALPLTPWWRETRQKLIALKRSRLGQRGGAADWTAFPQLAEDCIRDLTDGLMLMRREIMAESGAAAETEFQRAPARIAYLRRLPVDLLWLVRLGGVIGAAFNGDYAILGPDDALGRALERDFITRDDDDADNAAPRDVRRLREGIARAFGAVYASWTTKGAQPSDQFIWRVTQNREVSLAVAKSVLTVKADAARRLFAISCRKITWAVIDSGIDGAHPAFADTSAQAEAALRADDAGGAPAPVAVADLPSRVTRTLDFTHIRDLLDLDIIASCDEDSGPVDDEIAAERDALCDKIMRRCRDPSQPDPERPGAPPEETRAWKTAARARAREHIARLKRRILRGNDLDWEDLEPLILATSPELPSNDHGTHVAGVLGADWVDEDVDETLPLAVRPRVMQGMCPDINLIDVRVFRDDGKTDEFELLAAVQFLRWMNSRAGHMVVHGANMSLSLLHEVRRFACGQTPICEECNEAAALGLVIVAAAGNRGFQTHGGDQLSMTDGFRDATITDPGNAENVITVGATHRKRPHEYGVSYFSSRGPTGDGRLKPDLVAPGEKIKGPTPDGGAEAKDGTSMAAPHVSGAAAMLMARHSELVGDPARIKQVLRDTATDLGRERYFQGSGLLDILRALQSV